MQIKLEELGAFKDICRRICINIPSSCQWVWDENHCMAAVTLEKEDAELVFFPLFKEFQNHWEFDSTPEVAKAVTNYVYENWGLMPGQALFTSHALCDMVLAVAWWPWGRAKRVSMRVGLIPINQEKLDAAIAYECLSHWLNL